MYQHFFLQVTKSQAAIQNNKWRIKIPYFACPPKHDRYTNVQLRDTKAYGRNTGLGMQTSEHDASASSWKKPVIYKWGR